MTFFELDDFIADKYNTKYIKGGTDPENFDLILGNKRSQPGNSKDRYYVHQIMSATRNHGRRGSSADTLTILPIPSPSCTKLLMY